MSFFTEEYKKTMMPRLIRMIGVASLDVVTMVACALAALWARFDFSAFSTIEAGYVDEKPAQNGKAAVWHRPANK